jgi:hypothetical protein
MMPSRAQLRKQGEDTAIVNRLKASYVPRKFPSLHVEIVEAMIARVVDDEQTTRSLVTETVLLLPEHAIAFCRGAQGIGKLADCTEQVSTASFCKSAREFRSRLVRPGVHLVVISIDHEHERPSIDALSGVDRVHEWVTCNSVAGCLPMQSASAVTALCCCCGRASNFDSSLFELCACGASIFCKSCRSSKLRSAHDCLNHEQRAREIVAHLILKCASAHRTCLQPAHGRMPSASGRLSR